VTKVLMTYVAFLRGINVGGKNITKMAALKACLENAGFDRVETFIQSGNVVFESGQRSAAKLTSQIDAAVDAALGLDPRVVVLSRDLLKAVLAGAPAAWRSRTDLRMNIAFLRPPVTAAVALKEVDVRPGVDAVAAGKGVLYMSTALRDLGKSRMSRIVMKPVYQEMTIRTYATCQKILALMERPRAGDARASGANIRRHPPRQDPDHRSDRPNRWIVAGTWHGERSISSHLC
jgi:uncharacterized protein (DUF1697 family)